MNSIAKLPDTISQRAAFLQRRRENTDARTKIVELRRGYNFRESKYQRKP